jgi:hypothetical protein
MEETMSGMTNQQLIEKAQITTSDLAAAGKLSPVQSDKFLDYVIDVTQLMGNVRIVRFRNEQMDIDKIGVHTRVSVPKIEATAPNVRRGVTTSKVTLQPVAIMTPFEVSDEFTEHNIEGEGVVNTVIRMMATQTANDMEELSINGNTLGPAQLESDMLEGGSTTLTVKDTFLEMFNGWLRLADSANVYDCGGNDISFNIISRMINTMPTKFRRVRRNLRILCSLDHEQLYRERVASRQTAAGDAATSSMNSLTPFGIPLVGVPLLDSEPLTVEHFTLGAAPAVATLAYGPIGTTLYVNLQTLAGTPTAPLTEGAASDYTVDRVAGTVTSVAGGALNAGGSVKITYHTAGQLLLTDYQNLIFAIGRDIRIERDRDIYKTMHQFAITTKLHVQIEEVTALVKGINLGLN